MEKTHEKFDEKLDAVKTAADNLPVEKANDVPLYKRAAGKIKGAVASVGTRTVVVVCSVLLIGLAVILNYALAGQEGDVQMFEPTLGVSEDEGLSVADTYFASSILSRDQARDEAIEVLKTVVNNEAALEDAKESALTDIARIAGEIETEANIETLIKSKGFEECIAVVTGSNANIIVKSDGLMENELSQIKEIVYEQAGIDPVNIKIVEKK
ncbi:MAG: SpoIIIAH-like family protein [Clostridia bacterium]|nr:SpoIIIAH-like family protein [Clostridia bacterium]